MVSLDRLPFVTSLDDLKHFACICLSLPPMSSDYGFRPQLLFHLTISIVAHVFWDFATRTNEIKFGRDSGRDGASDSDASDASSARTRQHFPGEVHFPNVIRTTELLFASCRDALLSVIGCPG